MKKLLPLGLSDYKELRESNNYYVDKTLLIQDIQESGKAILVPRPRRFGKTLNLSMLYYFYTISESSNAHLFVDTEIWKFSEYRALQGAFPTIFITFKEIIETNFVGMLEEFHYVIAQEFKKHTYLLEGATLDDDEKSLFERISGRKATKLELKFSLSFLVQMLARYHKKRVILLIDEYDVPVQTGYLHGFYDEIIAFVRGLLTGPFKDQSNLEKGVITGNLAVAKAGIFSGLNNLTVLNITQERMAERFGFTQTEVDELLQYYELEAKRDEIRAWFNGYMFGETAGIFNPWSVLQCVFHNGRCKPYWSNTSDNLLLKRIIGGGSEAMKTDLELLFQNKPVIKPIEEMIVFPELHTKPNLVWSLLLYSGYLTYSQRRIKADKEEWFLVIPNKEILSMLSTLITDIFSGSILSGDAQKLLVDLTQGNVESFSDILQSFVENSMSAFDITNDEPERSYHLFVLGILVMLKDTYDIKSNRESGLGRYDIMIIPKNVRSPGIIIEFKKVRPDSKETLEIAAKKALDQILAKNYQQELTQRGVQTIIAYGIAFERRSVFVKCMRIERGMAESCQAD